MAVTHPSELAAQHNRVERGERREETSAKRERPGIDAASPDEARASLDGERDPAGGYRCRGATEGAREREGEEGQGRGRSFDSGLLLGRDRVRGDDERGSELEIHRERALLSAQLAADRADEERDERRAARGGEDRLDRRRDVEDDDAGEEANRAEGQRDPGATTEPQRGAKERAHERVGGTTEPGNRPNSRRSEDFLPPSPSISQRAVAPACPSYRWAAPLHRHYPVASLRLGIRVQLVFAMGALLLLALVPLYLTTTQLTQAALASARESAARALGRATAAHVLAATAGVGEDVSASVLDAQVGDGGLEGIAIYDAAGLRATLAGSAVARQVLPDKLDAPSEGAREARAGDRRMLLVIVPDSSARGGAAVALVALDGGAGHVQPSLPRIVGLYTGMIALAVLVFSYIVLTRIVVRPIVNLSDAARRVAEGGRTLEVPRAGAAELVDLGRSVASMTERLRADGETVRRQLEELEQKNAELMRAQEHLVRSERLASVGRLAAGMAHEIGNPITAILGLQEVLLAGGSSEEEQRDFLERMQKETHRIHRVLRDLLDFARPDAEPASADPRGSVAQAVADVAALVAPQKELRDVTLEQVVEADLPTVAMNEGRIVQVVLNLVLNAASAVSKPGGRILVRAAAIDERRRVRLIVEDDGPGIAPAIRGRLFEPFTTTKAPGEGTGLGLAVCRGLVEAAGGTITVEDGAPRDGGAAGASFVVVLPAARSVRDA